MRIRDKVLAGFVAFLFMVAVPAGADVYGTRFAEKPEHAILVVIDGLSYHAIERFNLPVLSRMAARGTLVEQNYLPPAADPRVGAYAELHSCSIPNPIMMAGTVFITRETRYLQDCFPRETTAFVANTTSYTTLDIGYTYSYQEDGPDADAVRMALSFMDAGKPAFMRVHLQQAGGAGAASMFGRGTESWRGNIWDPGSPYRAAVQTADNLVGVLLAGLEKQGVLEKTAIIIMGDHGQNDGGWHPLEYLDSSITSIVLFGAGIRPGVRVPYAEQIDVVPTVCALMGVKPPETSQGRVIAEGLIGFKDAFPPRKTLIRDMNESFIQYRKKMSEAAWRIENLQSNRQGAFFSMLNNIRLNYYDINKFVEWPRFSTMDELIANNAEVMARLDALLVEVHAAK